MQFFISLVLLTMFTLNISSAMDPPPQKQAIIVLGMHRGGTSATTRVANLLFDADLPKKLSEIAFDNPSGHWESDDMYQLNDSLFQQVGMSWHSLLNFPPDWVKTDKAVDYIEQAKTILQQQYPDSTFFIYKDPRISRLFPFWREVFVQSKITTHVIIPVRNPLDVASSLNKIHGISFNNSLVLWLLHLLEGERYTRGYNRVFIHYTDLIDNTETTCQRLVKTLGLPCKNFTKSLAAIDEFLTTDLRHYNSTYQNVVDHQQVPSLVKEVYASFLQLCASGTEDKNILTKLDNLYARLKQAQELYNPILYTAKN